MSGSLEVRVLVGPAEVVGLAPQAVGNIPFTVGTAQSPNAISAGDHLSYHEVLVEESVTYDVTFDADITIDGTCDAEMNGAQLSLSIGMAWDQVLHVTSEGFDETYPVSGEQTKGVVLPLVDGASGTGEGFEVVLHLAQ